MAPHHVHVFNLCATYAFHLVIFNEKSLFVGIINYISVGQTAIFHLKNIWCCDETTITLTGFLKVGQLLHLLVSWKSVRFPESRSGECKAKPLRTH